MSSDELDKIDKIELWSTNSGNNILVFSDDMLIGLRSAVNICHKIGFGFNKEVLIGIYGEGIIYSEINKKQEIHLFKIDETFDEQVRKIQYG